MSNIIENAVTDSSIDLGEKDEIKHAWFDSDTGKAVVRIQFDMCATAPQVDSIRESDLWEIEAIHPANTRKVDIHVKEV